MNPSARAAEAITSRFTVTEFRPEINSVLERLVTRGEIAAIIASAYAAEPTPAVADDAKGLAERLKEAERLLGESFQALFEGREILDMMMLISTPENHEGSPRDKMMKCEDAITDFLSP